MAKTEVFKPTGTTAKASKVSTKLKSHKLLKGEELWQVATKHGVSVRQLAELNQIDDLSVSPGTVIQLP